MRPPQPPPSADLSTRFPLGARVHVVSYRLPVGRVVGYRNGRVEVNLGGSLKELFSPEELELVQPRYHRVGIMHH